LDEGNAVITLGGKGVELRDWIEISDVVRLLELLSDSKKNTPLILNGGTGVATSVAEIATMVLNFWGRSNQIEFSGQGRRGDPRSLVANKCTLDAMGFCMKINVEQGIESYVNWFKGVQK
jgi:UDP-glucose 4-epimerase